MTTTNNDKLHLTPDPLLCLSDVLTLIKVSESTWWAGVAAGKFPKPVKCGRRSFWPRSTITSFIESLKVNQVEITDKKNKQRLSQFTNKQLCTEETE